jgi:GMP synthase-like glutamine amidotransferase
MKLLVLQHARVEHPGSFRKFLREDGHDWVTVELDEGEALPALDGFDALWVMGGPMDVWEEDEYPWLREEKALIQEAVEGRGMPFLGLCLGHQLLAEALGGSCGASEQPEIGVMPVQLTEAGATSIVLDDLPDLFDCLQWHSVEVKIMPAGAACFATSPACAVQVMQWGPRATSLQFHLEVEPDTVTNWVDLPAYETALKSALGAEGPAILKASCDEKLAEFEKLAERVYINWLQTTARV